MHPFWAVRRMSAKEVEVYNAAKATTTQPLAFNCHMETKCVSDVQIATLSGEVVNCTRSIEIPCLVNFRPLVEGEELLMEKVISKEKKTNNKKEMTWRDKIKENDKKRFKFEQQEDKAAAKKVKQDANA